jgi:hypothetical protein
VLLAKKLEKNRETAAATTAVCLNAEHPLNSAASDQLPAALVF